MTQSSFIETKNLHLQPKQVNAYASVVFNLPIRNTFTYEVPKELQSNIQVGMRVFAPFGNRKLTGYVVALATTVEASPYKIKTLADLLDPTPVLGKEILDLTKWMADYYQASWGEAIKTALPGGLDDESREVYSLTKKGISALEHNECGKTASLILLSLQEHKRLNCKQLRLRFKKQGISQHLARLKRDELISHESTIKQSRVTFVIEKIARVVPSDHTGEQIEKLLSRSPKQKEVYKLLLKGEQILTDLAQRIDKPADALKKLREKKIVEVINRKKPREGQGVSPDTLPKAQTNLKLTTDQQNIYEEICQSIEKQEFKTFLMHGVTGSGKTEVYIRCIQRILQMGKTAIMLVPEISLTPQTVSRFLSRFGRQVAILHSGLSQVERYQEWEKVRAGKVSIVVGARSAVFAPFENLGIIVIDEEHDASYKQDNSPRYHARDTAIVRAKAQNATIILGSATPSIETRNNAESGKYKYLALNSRVQDRLLPVIRILDMKKERMERKNFSILSNDIKSGIRLRLDRKEQTFLFLNRRGTANYVYCKECGYVFNCHRCSVTMTYHGSQNRFRCHYCNHSERVPDRCAECNGEVIKFSGFGTQKLEEETRKLFPDARILRLDRDTTRKRSAFENMHSDMVQGNIDILIGTQMIAKGHDFPNVTLVGVVHADLSLNIPDFRSCERSFQLLAQVAGRAGRGEVPGLVILQTHTPNHYVYDFVREHNYEKFFHKEMDFRRMLNYPPYTRMVALEITSNEEGLGETLAKKIKFAVSKLLKTHKDVELLGPSRAALYRLNNKFRWHIILRSASVRSLRAVLDNIRDLTEWKPGSKGKVKLSIDVDPVNLL